MPKNILRFEPTPNPHALKCILARPLPVADGTTLPFRSAESAASDPVAARLFAVPGVTGLLLSTTWLTVNKAAGASWPEVKRGVEDALGPA